MDIKVVYDIETTYIYNGHVNVCKGGMVYANKELAENSAKKMWELMQKETDEYLRPAKIEVVEMPIIF